MGGDHHLLSPLDHPYQSWSQEVSEQKAVSVSFLAVGPGLSSVSIKNSYFSCQAYLESDKGSYCPVNEPNTVL